MQNNNLFLEIEKHLLNDEKPSLYLKQIVDNNLIDFGRLGILKNLKNVEQEKKHHPEGNVWNHTLQVVDEASKFRNYAYNMKEFMWAALLHDLGKISTTKIRKGRWTAYNHDRVGADVTLDLLNGYCNDKEFNNGVSKLVRNHMIYLYVNKNLPFGDIDDMIENTELIDVVLLTLSDRLGRGVISENKRNDIVKSLEEFIVTIENKTGNNYSYVVKILHEAIK